MPNPRNPFYRPNSEADAVRKLINDQIPDTTSEGDVTSVSANGSLVQVRVHGSSKVSSAVALSGLSLSVGDRVVMIKSGLTGQWVILGGYVANPSIGARTSATSGNATGAPLAPSHLTISPSQGLLIVSWQVEQNFSGVFQLELADNTSESDAQFVIISGCTFPYLTPSIKYFRVRAADEDWTYSSWTGWVSGTPTVPSVTPISQGGTGQDNNTDAFDALAPGGPVVGDMLTYDGTHWVREGAEVDGYVLMATNNGIYQNVSSTKRLIDGNATVLLNNQYVVYGSLEVSDGITLDLEGEVYVI